VQNVKLQPEGSGSGLNGSSLVLGGNGIGRVDQQSQGGHRREQFVQQFQFLGSQLHVQSGHSGEIAPWSIQAGDEPCLDRIGR